MIERANRALIKASTAALQADAGLAAAFAGKPVQVLEIVPEMGPSRPVKYPLVTFGGAEKQRLPDSCGKARALVSLFVQVWDADQTITRLSDIAEACEAPLLKLALAPETGLAINARRHVVTRCQYDRDSALLYGLCQIEFQVNALAG
ncbi:DUF3168 domain-containing protein [Hyphomonas sp.]|uniref:tail completion protein gp17 n=1 Tax=Hyphomonas sp. TaxID=87 RepID=UPI0025C2DCD3|nr:DUF3168 domain-containing protein [Hyphomonas sp.]MBI1401455.1 DUF3168 domain-containing protein [Hyphomonas sp.]